MAFGVKNTDATGYYRHLTGDAVDSEYQSGARPTASTANLPLRIVQPQAGLTKTNIYYKAYTDVAYTDRRVGGKSGKWPYTYSLPVKPTGMTIDPNTGALNWTTPVELGSPHAVTAQIVDANGTTETVSWTITVNTTDWLVLDVTAPGGGDGTMATPFNNMDQILLGRLDSTYNGKGVLVRAGPYLYPFATSTATWSDSNQIELRSHPEAWVGYPGEAVTFDGDYSAGAGNPCHFYMVQNAEFGFINITFDDNYNVAIECDAVSDNLVVGNCDCSNITKGPASDNSGFVAIKVDANTLDETDDASFKKNFYMHDMALTNCNTGGIELYGTKYGLMEDIASNDTYFSAINFKSTVSEMQARNISVPTSTGLYSLTLLAQYYADKIELDGIYCAGKPMLISDYGGTGGVGEVWVTQSTFDCEVWYKEIGSDDGPVYWDRCVVVNETAYTNKLRDEISEYATITAYVSEFTGHLSGNAADTIIDANGSLIAPYITSHPDYGHENY